MIELFLLAAAGVFSNRHNLKISTASGCWSEDQQPLRKLSQK